MKNCITVKHILVSTWVVFALLGGHALATTISFTPEDPTFVEDNLQTIEVMVDEVDDLLAFSLAVGFDPAVVTPVSVTAGEIFSDGPCDMFFMWVNASDFVDTIEVDAAHLGCTTSGGGILFRITFAGVASGNSPLTIQDLDLRDGLNAPIAADSLPGSVHYLSIIPAHLSFLPEAVLFEEDGTCEICINIEEVPDFLGMSVEFQFDPAVITPIAVTPGQVLLDAGCPFFLDWVNAGSFLNTMLIDTALLGCTQAVEGPMVCITFQGVGYGESPLNWLLTDVRDSNNEGILIRTSDGMVLFNSAVASTQATWGGLKSLYSK